MNERIARLRTKNLTQQPEICSERAQIVTRAYEKYKDLPPLLLRAKTCLLYTSPSPRDA